MSAVTKDSSGILKQVAVGFLAVLIIAVLINSLAVLVPQQIIDHHVSGIKSADDIKKDGDGLSSCSALQIAVYPGQNGFLGAVFDPHTYQWHPEKNMCDDFVQPSAESKLIHNNRYWWGAAYVLRLVLGAMSYQSALYLYAAITLGALALFSGSLFSMGGQYRYFAAIFFVFSLLGQDLPVYASNISHGPCFSVALLIFSFSIWKRREIERRNFVYGLAAFAGAAEGYFDLLCGGIPFALSLLLFVGFFVLRRDIKQTILASLIYALSVGVMAVIKLPVVYFFIGQEDVFTDFIKELLWRTSSETVGGAHVSLTAVFIQLWSSAENLLPFTHAIPNRIILVLEVALWPVALMVAFARKKMDGQLLALFLCALSTIAWYVAFSSHSFIHSWFMARVFYLPMVYGGMALCYAVSSESTARLVSGRDIRSPV